MSTTATPPVDSTVYEVTKTHPRYTWKTGERVTFPAEDAPIVKSLLELQIISPVKPDDAANDLLTKAMEGYDKRIRESIKSEINEGVEKSFASIFERMGKMKAVTVETPTNQMHVIPGQNATPTDFWAKCGIKSMGQPYFNGPTFDGRWKSLGHFASQVRAAKLDSSLMGPLKAEMQTHMDLVQKSQGIIQKAEPGTGIMGEIITTDGEVLVPPQYTNQIWERVYMNQILQLCDHYPIMSSSMTFPRNEETSRATGSRKGGVRGYHLEEASTFTASKPTYGTLTIRPSKIGIFMGSTDELLEDAAAGGIALDFLMTRNAGEEFNFMIGDDIINGNGVGKCQGLLNSPALISVSKETGQAAATIVSENIFKMWQRMYAPSRMNSLWLYNQDIEHQLFSMTLSVGTGGVVTYMPPGGLANSPFATLMGRPMMATEFNPTLGTVGDLMLVDMSQFNVCTRGGVKSATSMHFYFDTERTAFRFSFRIGGKHWWKSALTPFKGTTTQSPVIALATRS